LQDDEDVAVEEIDEETAVKLFGQEGAARLFSGKKRGSGIYRPPATLGRLFAQ
jgi:hypothetical protein